MPIYEYVCAKCGYKFELLRHLYETGKAAECPVCGEKSPEALPSRVNVPAATRYTPFSSRG